MSNTLRPITALPLTGLIPAQIQSRLPILEWVEPKLLSIEESYQRNLGEKSITLIRRIVANWSWSRMKPPICARGEDGKLYVIDGQHTAIAAITHGGIKKLPVMVVEASSVKDRASSFMGHNRDRVAMTPSQLYYASVAAQDPVAMATAEACAKAGVTIRKSVPSGGVWRVGDTISPNSIMAVAAAKGAPGAARALKILVDAERAPITALEVKAVCACLYEKSIGGGGQVDGFDLATVIRSRGAVSWVSQGQSVRNQTGLPLFRAVARAWIKSMPKKAS